MKAALKWSSFIAGIAIISLLLYNYVFFVIAVPSASMYPTIEIGDRIITARIHNTESIERKDILVFYSEEFKEVMVKRVIGLPNDIVEINSNGDVFVNDQKLDEPYVKYPDERGGKFTVPDGEYFFLGDYREHSYDSRLWKYPFISEENIMGKAKLILMPFNRMSVLN